MTRQTQRTELCHRHRPKKLSDVVGQSTVTDVLRRYLLKRRVPHAMLFEGPSGVGKTTCARIMQKELGCDEFDYQELNAASYKGIDMVRDVESRVRLKPMVGKNRLWVIDEAHQLTKPAQDAILKVLEDPPSHAYFILCTTEAGKLRPTVRNRCTRFTFTAVSESALKTMIAAVLKKEGVEVPKSVINKVIEASDSSARKALVILDKVIMQETKKGMLRAVEEVDGAVVAFKLVQTLIPFRGKPSWNEVKAVLEGIKDEDPEQMRQMILKTCQTHMLRGGPMSIRAFDVFQSFRDNYFDTGRTGLVASAFEVVHKLK